MRRMSLQRRKVVVMAGSVAAMGGVGPVLAQRHPRAEVAWVALLAGMLIVTIAQLIRLKRHEW